MQGPLYFSQCRWTYQYTRSCQLCASFGHPVLSFQNILFSRWDHILMYWDIISRSSEDVEMLSESHLKILKILSRFLHPILRSYLKVSTFPLKIISQVSRYYLRLSTSYLKISRFYLKSSPLSQNCHTVSQDLSQNFRMLSHDLDILS